MLPFNIGQYVKTPDGIGRVLYYTPSSVVVLFGTSANQYPLSALSTLESYQVAQKPEKRYTAIDLEYHGDGKIAQI